MSDVEDINKEVDKIIDIFSIPEFNTISDKKNILYWINTFEENLNFIREDITYRRQHNYEIPGHLYIMIKAYESLINDAVNEIKKRYKNE